jgi:peptidoglycan-associated lipoprotein
MLYERNTLLVLLSLTAITSGCAAQESLPKSSQLPSPAVQTAAIAAQTDLFVKNENLQTIYFESGKSTLDPKGMEIAKKNVEWLKPNLPSHLEVGGYSDGRGTPEQNLATGQRRASSLRDFYVKMGIPRSRISTVSFGEEEPECFEDTEECSAKNRRVETLIENKSLAAK